MSQQLVNNQLGQSPGDASPERSIFVSPEEFRELAVSHRPLIRFDLAPPGVRGLVDRVTRVRYLVDERRLAQSYAG